MINRTMAEPKLRRFYRSEFGHSKRVEVHSAIFPSLNERLLDDLFAQERSLNPQSSYAGDLDK